MSSAERVILPEPLGEQFMDEVIGRVLDHLDLFDDDFLLALDVRGREGRIHHDVRQHLQRQRQMLVEHLDVVAGVFLRREGVHLAADRVDRLRNVFGTARRRALEEHVLDEMRDPALRFRLVTRPARQPDADTDGTDVRHPLGQNAEPIRQNVADDSGLGQLKLPERRLATRPRQRLAFAANR